MRCYGIYLTVGLDNNVPTARVIPGHSRARELTPTYRARGSTTTVLMGSFGTGRGRPADEEPLLAFPMRCVRFCYNFALRFCTTRFSCNSVVVGPLMISLFGKNEPEPTLLEKLKISVSKTKAALSETVDTIFLGERKIDPALLKRLETALLSADLGVRPTREILDAVREKMDRNALADASQLKREIKSHIVRILAVSSGAGPSVAGPLGGAAGVSPNGKGPRVIFIVGVNGAGKTTSIGKLANRLRKDGLSVMLCAADTFRAAAVEQLEIWAQRNGIEVIKQKSRRRSRCGGLRRSGGREGARH